MKTRKDYISITYLKPLDYKENYVFLPKNYGSKKYFERKDIQAIKKAVFDNLNSIDKRTKFTEQIKNRKVIIKPNLVGVFYKLGFNPEIAPQSTDPRVIDSVIEYLKQYTHKIVIAESSGSGFPTRTSYRISRLKKIAKRHHVKLINIEEQPVVRYYLPKASAMKEILIPEIFDDVVKGDAFYITLPKMKTNLYTDISLGFKNAMGIIPLNLRQRDHNHNLEKKLVDILYLIKPNLTIVDGVIGAEGQCPAIAEPVDSHVIISGTNVVETDSVTSQMMGFVPEEVKLLKHAKKLGFGNKNVEIIGKKRVIPFKKANPSLMNDSFTEKFPEITVLIGHELEKSPQISTIESVTNSTMCEMELSCRGGCLVCTKMGLVMLVAEEFDNYKATIIIGKGVKINGKGPYYFDRNGKPFTAKDIGKINGPKLAVGDCSVHLRDICEHYIPGCLFHAGLVHVMLHKISKTKCRMTSSKNKFLLPFIGDTLKMRIARRQQIRKGRYVDISMNDINTRGKHEALSDLEKNRDYIRWDFPPMDRKLKRKLMKEEWESLLILF